MNMILTALTVLFSVLVRVFSWLKGKRDAKRDIELKQSKDAIEEVRKNKKRDNKLRRNKPLRERLYALYRKPKD